MKTKADAGMLEANFTCVKQARVGTEDKER